MISYPERAGRAEAAIIVASQHVDAALEYPAIREQVLRELAEYLERVRAELDEEMSREISRLAQR